MSYPVNLCGLKQSLFFKPGGDHRQAGGTAGRRWERADLLLRGQPLWLRLAAALRL